MKTLKNASITKRFLALLYDSFLLFAILLVATLPAVLLNGGQEINDNAIYKLYILMVLFFYYAWQWRHGGQTLAMRTWKIKLISRDNARITWQQCIVRFIFGCFGLTIISAAFSQKGLAIHDRVSHTQCVILEKVA